MDADERRFSLSWAPDGNVEPRPIWTTDLVGRRDELDTVDQDELDRWWAEVAGGRLGEGRQ